MEIVNIAFIVLICICTFVYIAARNAMKKLVQMQKDNEFTDKQMVDAVCGNEPEPEPKKVKKPKRYFVWNTNISGYNVRLHFHIQEKKGVIRTIHHEVSCEDEILKDKRINEIMNSINFLSIGEFEKLMESGAIVEVTERKVLC